MTQNKDGWMPGQIDRQAMSRQWPMAGNWQLATGRLPCGLPGNWTVSRRMPFDYGGVDWSGVPEKPHSTDAIWRGRPFRRRKPEKSQKKKNHQAVKLMSTTSCRQVCPVVKQKYKKNGKKPKKMNEIFRMMSILNCYKYLTKSYTRIVKPLILHFSI